VPRPFLLPFDCINYKPFQIDTLCDFRSSPPHLGGEDWQSADWQGYRKVPALYQENSKQRVTNSMLLLGKQ
jgi:hypothetical protein